MTRSKRPLNIAQFDAAIKSISPARAAKLDAALTYATIPQMQRLFQQGALTSEELVNYYLWRIQRYDLNKLNSVTELNPDALEIARQLDAERKAGKVRGPLHGTAALIIDVIGTGDTAFWVKNAGEKYFAETNAPMKTWQEVVAFNNGWFHPHG